MKKVGFLFKLSFAFIGLLLVFLQAILFLFVFFSQSICSICKAIINDLILFLMFLRKILGVQCQSSVSFIKEQKFDNLCEITQKSVC